MNSKGNPLLLFVSILLLRLEVVCSVNEMFTKQFTDMKPKDSVTPQFSRSPSECSLLCVGHSGCYGFSFCSSSNTCYLSSEWTSFYKMESETNCRAYKRGEAFDIDDVIRLDGLNFTLYPGPATKQEARDACASEGRLLQLPTAELFWAVEGVLLSLSLDGSLTNLWTGGEYDPGTGTWLYADGSPMPLDDDGTSLLYTDEANPTCVRLKQVSSGYKWHDFPCTAQFAYICEQV